MTRRDARGNPVSTGSATALDASERALWRMMSFYGTPLADLDAAIAADPAWPLPRLMKAGFLLSLTEPSLVGDADALLDETAALVGRGDERERAHHAALRRLAGGDWVGAGARWQGRAAAPPARRARAAMAAPARLLSRRRDALARSRRGGVAGVAGDDPLQPYVLALHAFGLEESGRYAEAERAGRRALAAGARVPWAIHAVAHVMEMQGRHEEGARWMGEWRHHWGARDGDGGGREPTASRSPRLARSAVRARRPRHRHGAARLRRLPRRQPDRDHAPARRRRGVALATCACSAPMSAIAGRS
jgi:hypothetical protein